ncbi:hypothetical protein TNCV_2669961 [Trichonephila clavipes]|nr:hypothetical protein TNCV_2669961 [Trichonephila clavipes]
MNAARHIEILTRFTKRLHRVRPQYAQQGSRFFVHDSARPHTVNNVKQFLAKKWVVQIEHPSFSPDLNPTDFCLFLRHATKHAEAFELHLKRRLLAKFPGHV